MTEKEEKELQYIRERIAQMRAREKAILACDKKRQRKQETCRLIKNGTLAEKYLGCKNMNPFEFERLLRRLVEVQSVKENLKRIKQSLLWLKE